MIPSIGRIVHYTLAKEDAEKINRRREHARLHLQEHIANSNGVQIHVGNEAHEGNILPMIIVAVHGQFDTSSVNGQVLMDGNDLYWVKTVQVGEGPGTFAWPPRV
jgi:hypothetical protein